MLSPAANIAKAFRRSSDLEKIVATILAPETGRALTINSAE